MSLIRVRNFGPITEGYVKNDGFMDIKKFTFLIGNQGTGKSSIAKLFSTMSWLEKALYKEEITAKYVMQYSRFVKEYCNYQNLVSYFNRDTEIT